MRKLNRKIRLVELTKRVVFGLLLILPAGFLLSLTDSHVTPTATTRPNVVLILMDDMGYGDLSCTGATSYTTPNIDQLAREGTRFTNFLSAHPICTASRAALLTGCYSNRVGLSGALFPDSRHGLNASEETIAELLKEQGYATGIFGKWHLGHLPDFLPGKHGFDEFYGIPYSNDMWPVAPGNQPIVSGRKAGFPALSIIEGSRPVDTIRTLADQATLTGQLTDRAIDFINRHRKAPFFLYLPYHMMHIPIAASPRFAGKSGAGLYADVAKEIDWSVGNILKTLEANGLAKNTLVIFTSDNGPWLSYGNHAGSAGGFREGKMTTFEGGHRVPCLMRWPGVIPAGRVCNQLLTGLDLLPTLADFCGARHPRLPIDGKSAVSLLTGQSDNSPRTEFYYYYRANSLEAVRRKNFKLVFAHQGRHYEGATPGKDGLPGKDAGEFSYPGGLYDLDHDPGERVDVSSLYPTVRAELEALGEKARGDLGDDLQQRKGTNIRPSGRVVAK